MGDLDVMMQCSDWINLSKKEQSLVERRRVLERQMKEESDEGLLSKLRKEYEDVEREVENTRLFLHILSHRFG